jgi:hypothetical protein
MYSIMHPTKKEYMEIYHHWGGLIPLRCSPSCRTRMGDKMATSCSLRCLFCQIGPHKCDDTFHQFTMCSLYGSHWMFLPSPFLVLTKRSHKTWWASCGDRTAFTWNWSLNASRLYLVRPVALKCGSISRQQRKTRSPSPAWAQQRVMLHDQYIQWREFVDKSWLFIFLLFL